MTKRVMWAVPVLAVALSTVLALNFSTRATGQDNPRRQRPENSQERPERPQGEGRAPQGGPPGGPQNVGAAMKGIGRSLKQLREQIDDSAKKTENLKLIGDMERFCVQAKSLNLPPKMLKKEKDADSRTKLGESYRTELIPLLRKMLDVEQAILDGKSEDARNGLDAIEKMRDAGHEKLGVKEDDDKKP